LIQISDFKNLKTKTFSGGENMEDGSMTDLNDKEVLSAEAVETIKADLMLGIERLESVGELDAVLDIANFSTQAAVSIRAEERA
jgi:hypothetical protein